MVMQRSHTEHALSGGFEDADLDDVRQHDGHEKTADDDGKQLSLSEDRQAGDRAAQRESTRIPHEDLRRRRVPPQEARQRAN